MTTLVETSVLDDDILLVKLHGDLDASTTEQLNEQVQVHFDEGRMKVIIDGGHLGYISSLGVGALVALQSRLRKRGGEVKLAAIQGTAAEVLKAVRLDKLLQIYGDAEFARKAFATAS